MGRPYRSDFRKIAEQLGVNVREVAAAAKAGEHERAARELAHAGPLWRARRRFLEHLHAARPGILVDLWDSTTGDRTRAAVKAWSRRHNLDRPWIWRAADEQLEVWRAIRDLERNHVAGIGWARWTPPRVNHPPKSRARRVRNTADGPDRPIAWLVRWFLGEHPLAIARDKDGTGSAAAAHEQRPGENVRTTVRRLAVELDVPVPPQPPRGRPRRRPS